MACDDIRAKLAALREDRRQQLWVIPSLHGAGLLAAREQLARIRAEIAETEQELALCVANEKRQNLLFDSWSSQVLYQRAAPSYPPKASHPGATGMRLNTLLGAITSIGLSSGKLWNVAFTKPPITAAQLDGVDVYVSLTRYQGAGFAYTRAELDALQTWVNGGGSILLMSNHGGFPGNPDDDWTINDAPLAALFGVTLRNYSVQNWNRPSSTSNVMSVRDDVPYIANQAPSVTSHNSCIIDPSGAPSYTSLVQFPETWTAYNPVTHETGAPPTPHFSVLVPGAAAKAGSLIVTGNSGLIGDYGSPLPACGLAPYESNLMFTLNCLGYLGGIKTIPPAGECP